MCFFLGTHAFGLGERWNGQWGQIIVASED